MPICLHVGPKDVDPLFLEKEQLHSFSCLQELVTVVNRVSKSIPPYWYIKENLNKLNERIVIVIILLFSLYQPSVNETAFFAL